jgi:enoyl-CoA hydratase/carnithine racemase
MLHADDHGQVRSLRLDRPDRLNAFDHVQFDEVAAAIRAAATDSGVRVVVITGTGRAFSAGADVKAVSDPSLAPLFSPAFERMLDAFAEIDKPVVAAVNGLAVGIGTTLLLHCDLVLADGDARFRTPFPQLATTPEAGSSLLLPHAAGAQFANWMLLTGEWVDAQSAAGAGLVGRVCPPGTVLHEAMAVAQRMAQLPPEPLAAAKRLIRTGVGALVSGARARENAEARSLMERGIAPRWR